MSRDASEGQEPSIDSFRVGNRQTLAAWRRLWETDRAFPVDSQRRFLAGPALWLKKVLRRLVRAPQADLWERQRAFNLAIQEHLETAEERLPAMENLIGGLGEALDRLGKDLQQVQSELVRDIRVLRETEEREHQELSDMVFQMRDDHLDFLKAHGKRLDFLEGLHNEGYDDVKVHTEALFSRVEQKLDRYRRSSRHLWSRLGSVAAMAEGSRAPDLAAAVADDSYVEFERRFRGREADIGQRLQPYLRVLEGRSHVLDLGCGRGEALEVMTAAGIACSGVDSNEEMVARCRAKGLNAEVGDLISALEERPEGSLGGVVSFHVIEHLDARAQERLVRLAWRALEPGGVLVLETPSPMSLVAGGRNFWLDPTHRRPVHPESLQAILEIAGFDPVERLDLQPFDDSERLPEIELADLPQDLATLADRVNRLRDRLDGLLHGFQDFGLIGHKPA